MGSTSWALLLGTLAAAPRPPAGQSEERAVLGGEPMAHRGVDAMHLVRTADGWRIVELADTRRREGCPP